MIELSDKDFLKGIININIIIMNAFHCKKWKENMNTKRIEMEDIKKQMELFL